MSKISDVAYIYMRQNSLMTIASDDLWTALCALEPDRTAKTDARKTPRTTAMRDLRKDPRFDVGGGMVSLVDGSREN